MEINNIYRRGNNGELFYEVSKSGDSRGTRGQKNSQGLTNYVIIDLITPIYALKIIFFENELTCTNSK